MPGFPLDRRSRVRAKLRVASESIALCGGLCALSACTIGSEAMVLQVRCASPDACRLRTLGVFEGARVTVVDGRNGLLLDVRGSRLAMDRRTADAIVVQPMQPMELA